MIIAIASGKGGTGKTTIATNLALSLKNVQLLDCDVEEPNAHLFLNPEIRITKPACVLVPEVDKTKCTYCGTCRDVCAYNAIAVLPDNKETGKKGNILIFDHLCHSCGACVALCPQHAIREIKKEIGIIEIGTAKDRIDFVHGKLNIGEILAPPLIDQVKSHINPNKTVIIDAPPGTACPVVATLQKCDACCLVTEPTPFGLNDLTLAVHVLRKMKIPFGVVLNRSDIGDDCVDQYCEVESIPILLRIPFRRDIAENYAKGQMLAEISVEFKTQFQKLFDDICHLPINKVTQ